MYAKYQIQRAVPKDSLDSQISAILKSGGRDFGWVSEFAEEGGLLKIEGNDRALLLAGGRGSILKLLSKNTSDRIIITDTFGQPQFLCVDVVRRVRKLHKNLTLVQLRTVRAQGFQNEGTGTSRIQYSDEVKDPANGQKGKEITVGELREVMIRMFERSVVEV